jgi:hypothetical protein
MCLYFQGMVGGLMTQLHTTVPHRDGTRAFKEDTFEKAESLGYNLAILAANALRAEDVQRSERPLVAVVAKTFKAGMENHFKYAIMLGLIHQGYYSGGYAKSEINVFRIGDVCILTTPGEIYPEIVIGGVEAKPGNDFGLTAPVESPPLNHFMKGKMNFVIGLANDEIGYMVPKSQWDNEPPYVYGHSEDRPQGKAQYGEVNSGGSDIAPTIWRHSKELLEVMNETHPFE